MTDVQNFIRNGHLLLSHKSIAARTVSIGIDDAVRNKDSLRLSKFLWGIWQACSPTHSRAQTVVQWIQIWTSRRPIICSYENRNITFKLLGSVYLVCWSKIWLFSFNYFLPKWSGVTPLQETSHQTTTLAGWWPRWALGITFFVSLEVFA